MHVDTCPHLLVQQWTRGCSVSRIMARVDTRQLHRCDAATVAQFGSYCGIQRASTSTAVIFPLFVAGADAH